MTAALLPMAIDTAVTIARALPAWLAILAAVLTVGVWACVGAMWAACEAVAAALAASGAVRALGEQSEAPNAPEGRVWLRPARVARPEAAATGPSRTRIRCQGAAQASGGGFPVPAPARAAEARSGPRSPWSPR